MIKRIFICLLVVLSITNLWAQSADEKVAQMLNTNSWFELRDFYQSNTESIDPFLDTFAKAMLAHFFNQNEQASELCLELLNSQQLDVGNLLSISTFLCDNLNRTGQNELCAKIIESIESSISPVYDQLPLYLASAFKSMIGLNKVKTTYRLDQVEPFEENISVPFTLTPIGSEKRESEVLDVEGSINGLPCTMVFDTGAGTNVISDSMAEALNLDIINLDLALSGVGEQAARFAVAKELTLGELKIYNVPFYVVTLRVGHQEADKHMDHYQIVIGHEIMEAVKHLSFDFEDNLITFMTKSNVPEDLTTNMCLSSGGNYMLKCSTFEGQELLLNPDTGDGYFGTIFSNMLPVFQGKAELVPSQEKLRWGGAGGYMELPYCAIIDMPLTIEGKTVIIPSMPILLEEATDYLNGYDGVMGIQIFKLFGKVTFDLERMILYPSK